MHRRVIPLSRGFGLGYFQTDFPNSNSVFNGSVGYMSEILDKLGQTDSTYNNDLSPSGWDKLSFTATFGLTHHTVCYD